MHNILIFNNFPLTCIIYLYSTISQLIIEWKQNVLSEHVHKIAIFLWRDPWCSCLEVLVCPVEPAIGHWLPLQLNLTKGQCFPWEVTPAHRAGRGQPIWPATQPATLGQYHQKCPFSFQTYFFFHLLYLFDFQHLTWIFARILIFNCFNWFDILIFDHFIHQKES